MLWIISCDCDIAPELDVNPTPTRAPYRRASSCRRESAAHLRMANPFVPQTTFASKGFVSAERTVYWRVLRGSKDIWRTTARRREGSARGESRRQPLDARGDN